MGDATSGCDRVFGGGGGIVNCCAEEAGFTAVEFADGS